MASEPTDAWFDDEGLAGPALSFARWAKERGLASLDDAWAQCPRADWLLAFVIETTESRSDLWKCARVAGALLGAYRGLLPPHRPTPRDALHEARAALRTAPVAQTIAYREACAWSVGGLTCAGTMRLHALQSKPRGDETPIAPEERTDFFQSVLQCVLLQEATAPWFDPATGERVDDPDRVRDAHAQAVRDAIATPAPSGPIRRAPPPGVDACRRAAAAHEAPPPVVRWLDELDLPATKWTPDRTWARAFRSFDEAWARSDELAHLLPLASLLCRTRDARVALVRSSADWLEQVAGPLLDVNVWDVLDQCAAAISSTRADVAFPDEAVVRAAVDVTSAVSALWYALDCGEYAPSGLDARTITDHFALMMMRMAETVSLVADRRMPRGGQQFAADAFRRWFTRPAAGQRG